MSRVPGFGAVPETWKVLPARRLLSPRRKAPPHDGDGIVTAFRDGQVTLRSNRRLEGFTEATDYSLYQRVHRGDLVVHSMDGFAGAIGVADSTGMSSPVVHAYEAKGDARYAAYCLRSLADSGYIQSLAKGVRERTSTFDRATLADVVLPVPPMEEQKRIANFLDNRIRRIDSISSAVDQQLRLATERLRLLIEEVLWHGRSHVALRRLVGSVTSGPRGWGDLVGDGEVPFLRIANLPTLGPFVKVTNLAYVHPPDGAEARRAMVEEGDVLLSITASLGNVAVVPRNLAGSAFSQHVARVRPHPGVDPWWLGWSLQSASVLDELRLSSYGGTKVGLGLAEVRGLSVPLASTDEQVSTAASLLRLWDTHVAGVGALSRKLQLLTEYKQSLITAAVSGEFDVTTASDRSVPAWA